MTNLRAPPISATSYPLWQLGKDAPPEGTFIALVPGAEAPMLALALPTGLKGAARVVVARRQVLDRLGSGYALRLHSSWTRALVTSEAAMAGWRAALGDASSRCSALLPDYLVLPVVVGGWCVAVDGNGLRVRLGPDDGFSAERDLALAMLALALEQARSEGHAPRSVLRLGPPDSDLEALLAGIAPTHDGAVLGHNEVALDLLRDPMATAAGLEGRLRRWLWLVALVMIGVLGWLVAEGIALTRDRAQTAALDDTVLAAVRRDLIPSAPIVDLQVQVQRAIEARRQGVGGAATDPLVLLRQAAGVLAGAEIRALTLSIEGLTADLRLPDFAGLDALLADLETVGLRVEVQRSGLEDGGVGAVLLLREVE